MVYRSIVLSGVTKKGRIQDLKRRLQQLEHERLATEAELRAEQTDLTRLYTEMRSLKKQRECLMKEKAAAESWWSYIWSFAPGKAEEYTRRTRILDWDMIDLVGKLRTKELKIHDKSKQVQTLKERVELSPLSGIISRRRFGG